jgi:NAD(P)-dependent dehydrogenase (short-subunit alcohol dehydrogenase family)
MVNAAREAYGELHILVNNAGVNFFGDLEGTTEEDWDRVMNIDLKSIFLACKHAVPLMQESGGGAIVNVGSISGQMGQRRHLAYCAAKAGVMNLTKALALDLGPEIRVNCICPGAVRTAMLSEVIDPDDPVQMERLNGLHPLGRIAEPEEIARANLFLCSDDSSFMTGAIVNVDGGNAAGQPAPVNTAVAVVSGE